MSIIGLPNEQISYWIMVINYTSRVNRTIVRDTPSCGVTYDCHSDDSIGVIYAQESPITLLENIYSRGVTHHMTIKIFLYYKPQLNIIIIDFICL